MKDTEKRDDEATAAVAEAADEPVDERDSEQDEAVPERADEAAETADQAESADQA